MLAVLVCVVEYCDLPLLLNLDGSPNRVLRIDWRRRNWGLLIAVSLCLSRGSSVFVSGKEILSAGGIAIIAEVSSTIQDYNTTVPEDIQTLKQQQVY